MKSGPISTDIPATPTETIDNGKDGTIHIFYRGEELPHTPIMFQEEKRYAPSHKEALAVGV